MKIGRFAKKYNVNITAVRYYVEKALLTPERKNGQYIFNDSCERDMEKILKYKDYRLSLDEIELLFFLEKTSKLKDQTILEIISEVFADKKRMLEEEIVALQGIVKKLDEEAKCFKTARIAETPNTVNGIPFSFIPYLYCPKCGKPLVLDSVSIANNKISKGEIGCGCGYSASIKDGVILCEGYTDDTPFKVFDNVESVLSITDECSSSYRALIDKTYMWMYHQINELENYKIVMAGPLTFNFMLKHCQNFNKDTTFVITDPSLQRIAKLQKYMGDYDLQTVYIAGDFESLPLRSGCVDVYIDDFSITNCIFVYNRSIYGSISPLMKHKGRVIGIFVDYEAAPNSLENFKKDLPNFKPEKMKLKTIKADLELNSMTMSETRTIGKTTGDEQHFPRNVVSEQVPILGYKAVKK